MNTRSVGYFADDFFLGEVNHDYLRGVADIKAAGIHVHGEVIPAAVATDGDFFQEFIARRGNRGGIREVDRELGVGTLNTPQGEGQGTEREKSERTGFCLHIFIVA